MSGKTIESQVLHYIHGLEKDQQKTVLNYLKNLAKKSPKNNEKLLALAGTINKSDIVLIENTIQEGCERIDRNEW